MRKCLVFDVLANFGTRRWHRVPLGARQLHQTSRDASKPCVHSSDIAMPRHLPISTPRLFDIPTVRLHLDTSAVTGCGIGWRESSAGRATRWRRVHRLRATRWDRVEIICLPTAVLSAFVPLGGVEWRDTETTVTLGISVELQHHSLSSSGATGMFRVPLCVALWRRASPVVSLREKPSSHVPRRTCQTGCAIM